MEFASRDEDIILMAGLIHIVFCDTNRIIMYLDVCFRLFFFCLWRGSACSRDVSCCIWPADLFVLHLYFGSVFSTESYGFAYLCVLLFICNQTASVLLDTSCGFAGFLLYVHCYIFLS